MLEDDDRTPFDFGAFDDDAFGLFDFGGPTIDQEAEAVADVAAELDADKSIALKHRRTLLNLLHVANAAQHLERLPDDGEAFHCIVKGNYPQWAMVPAMLQLAGEGATIEALHIATLGFSRANGDELLTLLDAGRVRSVTALVSCYFKAQDAAIYQPIHEGLLARGQRMLAMRTHAKIILARLSTGHAITIEGSANLRSCRNIEQFAIVNDAALHAFHAGWIGEIWTEHARTTTNADGEAQAGRELARQDAQGRTGRKRRPAGGPA